MPKIEWEFNWDSVKNDLKIVDKQSFLTAIALKFKKSCIITATFESGIGEKSRPFEKWYWAVLIPIQCQYYEIDDKDWMHEINLFQHAPRVHEGFEGKDVAPYKRTSSKAGKRLQMDRDEVFQFVNAVIFDEQTKGHDIPLPEE